jgi:hypothetical protein
MECFPIPVVQPNFLILGMEQRWEVSKHPGMRGLLATYPKANGNHGTCSSDGGRTASWPKLRNLLIIPYSLHRIDSHHENCVIARSRQRFRLGDRGKNGCAWTDFSAHSYQDVKR